MKKRNIAFYSNITKIFKYLVFIVIFSLIYFMFGVECKANVLKNGDAIITFNNYESLSNGKNFKYDIKLKYNGTSNAFYKESTIYSKDNKITLRIKFDRETNSFACDGFIEINNKKYKNDSTLTIENGGKFVINGYGGYMYSNTSKPTGSCTRFIGEYHASTVTIKMISDKKAPSLDELRVDNDTYQKSHTVTVSSSDTGSGVSAQKYCWSTTNSSSSCSWSNTSGNSITRNYGTGTYYFHVKLVDNVGNESDVTTVTVNMDNKGPTIKAVAPDDVTTWKNIHTVSDIQVSDNESGVKEKYYCWSKSYSTNSCNWISFTGNSITGKSLDGEFYLHIQAKDKVGNETKETVKIKQFVTCSSGGTGKPGLEEVITMAARMCTELVIVQFKFDNTGPTIAVPTPSDASTWAKSHTVSGITFDDNNRSGVDSSTQKYCWSTSSSNSNCTWTSFTGDSVKGEGLPGEHYLHVQVSDKAGNVGYGATKNAIKFDNKAPTITYTRTTGNRKEHSISNISITDSGGSGVSSKKYCWNTISAMPSTSDNCWKTIEDSTTKISSPTNIDGTRYLYILATDNVGNSTTKTEEFSFDNTGPTLEFFDDDRNYKTSGTITVKVTDKSGVNKNILYCWEKGTEVCDPNKLATLNDDNKFPSTISSSGKSSAGKWYLRVKAEDLLGNVTTSYSRFVKLYNSKSPTISFEYKTGTGYSKSHTVKVTLSDNSG